MMMAVGAGEGARQTVAAAASTSKPLWGPSAAAAGPLAALRFPRPGPAVADVAVVAAVAAVAAVAVAAVAAVAVVAVVAVAAVAVVAVVAPRAASESS